MEEEMDDFGDLYADVDVHVNAGIGIQLYVEEGNEIESDPKVELQSISQTESVDAAFDSLEKSNPKDLAFEAENENINGENGSDSEDDLHIVLNEEDCCAFPPSRGLIVWNGAKVDGNDEEDDLVIVTETDQTVKDRKWVDQLQSPIEGLEHGSEGLERGNSTKGGYLSQHSHFKYVRPHAASFSRNMKTSGSGGVVSFPSPLPSRGDWDTNGGSQCSGLATSSCNIGIPAVVHNGFDFFLPRNRTILDVGIETFERKPWRHPGVDMTDFFNFDLDEESWKTYCKRMGQFRQQTTMLTKIPVHESPRTNQVDEVHDTIASEAVPGEIAPNGQGERNSSDLENLDNKGMRRFAIPRGRAIQVEDGIGQRRSSMDRRPRHRDSDVVIQIAVQDPMSDSSSSGNEEPERRVDSIPKVSENGDFKWEEGNQGMQHISSACGDVLSSDCMIGRSRFSQPKAVCNALSVDHDNEGNEGIANLDADNSAKVEELVARETSETLETTKYCKEVTEEIPSKSDTSMVLSESALGSQIHRSSSPSDIRRRSKASRKASVDMDKAHSHPKKSSSPTPLYHQSKDSRRDTSNKEREFIKNNYRGQKQYKCGRGRLRSVAEMEIPMHNDKVFPEANGKGWYNRDHLLRSQGTRKERHRDSSFDDGEDLSYYRETEISIGYRSKRFAEKQIRRDAYTKFFHRNDYPHYREEMDTCVRRNWDEREYFLERDFSTRDNERRQRESYCQERGWNEESTQSVYERSSVYTERERYHLQRREREYEHQLREARDVDLVLEHRYREEFIQEKYGRDIPYSAREEDYIRERYGGHILYSEREMESSDRRDRYLHSSCFDIHSPWRSAGNGGGHWRHPDLSPSPPQTRREFCTARGREWRDTSPPRSYLDDTWKSSERYVDYGKLPNPRDKRTKKDTGRGWFEHNGKEHHYSSYEEDFDIDIGYNDSGGRSVYPSDLIFGERRGPRWKSKARYWTDDEVSSRHGDRGSSHSPEIPFQYERSSKFENSHIKHDSSHSEEFIGDHELERDRNNNIIWEGRRDSEVSHQIGSVSNIVLRGKQATLRCNESVNLHLNGCKRKFLGRCSRHDDRYPGLAIDTDKMACRHSEEFYTERRADFPSHSPKVESNYIHSISSKVERVDQCDSVHSTDHGNEKWFDKHPITQHQEVSVLEECQLLVEEPENEEVRTMTKKKPSSAVEACQSDNMEEKNKVLDDAGAGNKIAGVYDKHRILETIAKMEKRRERFKEPVGRKKEPECSPKPQPDLPVEVVAEVKQQRPARKRRWGGS